MITVIQRVSEARVVVNGEVIGEIEEGLLVLLGIETADGLEDGAWLTSKIAKMRIFGDEAGLMNRSLEDTEGKVLVISQFTLHASTKKGNRPSFIKAARPEIAIPLYEAFLEGMRRHLGEGRVSSGRFGADMKVYLINDGPVTIVMDSKNRQ